MAEYIDKEELEKFKYLSIVTYEGGKKENKAVIAIGCEIFNELPTIDIVHCKECRHRREFEEYNRTHNSFDLCVECEIDRKYHDDDYFCADGERSNNE